MTGNRSRLSRSQAQLLTTVRKLWKRSVLILTVSVTASAMIVVGLHFWPDTYRAEAVILVDSQKIPEKFVSATVNDELQDRLASMKQQILSSTRLEKIIETFHLYEKERKTHVQEEILEMMRGDIAVTVEKGWSQNRPGAFRISYSGQSPQTIADVTNQLANLFIEENLRTREVQAEGTSDFFKSQLAESKKNLDDLEAKVSSYKLRYNGELPEQQAALNTTLNRLQVELEGNQDALNRLHEAKTMTEAGLAAAQATEAAMRRAAADVATPAAGPSQSSSLADVRRRREYLESQLDAALLRYREDHPDVRNLRALLQATKDLETKMREGSQQETAPSDAPLPTSPAMAQVLAQEHERITTLQSRLQVISTETDTRQKERQRILADIAKNQARVETLPLREQDMAAVTRDYETAKTHYKSLLDKIFAANMAADMERRQKAERFTIIDPARVPEKPVSPNRPLFGGIGTIAAIALGIGIALLMEAKNSFVLGEWELPASAPVLGRVPVIETGKYNKRRRWALIGGAVICIAGVGGYMFWTVRG